MCQGDGVLDTIPSSYIKAQFNVEAVIICVIGRDHWYCPGAAPGRPGSQWVKKGRGYLNLYGKCVKYPVPLSGASILYFFDPDSADLKLRRLGNMAGCSVCKQVGSRVGKVEGHKDDAGLYVFRYLNF